MDRVSHAFKRDFPGHSLGRPVRRDFTVCHGGKARKRRGRLISVLSFMVAVAVTSVSGVWVLGQYGDSLLPAAPNTIHETGQAMAPSLANTPAPSSLPEYPAQNMEQPANAPAFAGHSLDVSLLSQKPELKNGCEATSLAILLRHYGYSVDKSILAYEYIPREDFVEVGDVRYGPHPGSAYPGDPATAKGFYCYPGPILAGANRFLAEQGAGLQAYDLTGASEEKLARQLYDGKPVMVWVTMEYGTQLSYLDFTWQLPDGTTYTPYGNLHCVVLSGVDESNYQVCDPINGTIYVNRDTLFASYQALGSMAVVVK